MLVCYDCYICYSEEEAVFKEQEPKSEDEVFQSKKEEEEIPIPDRLETISTNEKDSSGSEYNDSDTHSGTKLLVPYF